MIITHLCKLALDLGQIQRATHHPDGTPESDTTHTVMLGLLAMTLCPHEDGNLDPGLCVQFALVHDLTEVYAGDTNTAFGLTKEQKVAKAQRETAAFQRIEQEIGTRSPVVTLLAQYEDQEVPEARFIRYLDKITPKITHLLNDFSALIAMEMTLSQMILKHRKQGAELKARYPEFSLLPDLFQTMCDQCEVAYAQKEKLSCD